MSHSLSLCRSKLLRVTGLRIVNFVEEKRDGIKSEATVSPVHVNSAEGGQSSMRATRVGRDLDEKIIILVVAVVAVVAVVMKLGSQNVATS